MPPSAAESLKQRGGVGITVGLGLDEIDYGLLISLHSANQDDWHCRSQFAVVQDRA